MLAARSEFWARFWPHFWIWLFVALLAAATWWALRTGFRSLRRKRLIENTPTSKVKGVFLGHVEVKGKVTCERPLTSYLSERPCVHFSYSVSEEWETWVTEKDSQGKEQRVRKSGWTTVAAGGRQIPFGVEDETGTLHVVPDGADVHASRVVDQYCDGSSPLYYGKGPRQHIVDSTGRRHFQEVAIEPGHEAYVMGHARLREDVVEPEIAASEHADLFLISLLPERKIARRYAWGALFRLLLGALPAFLLPIPYGFYRADEFGRAARHQKEACIAAVAVYGGLIVLGYLLTLYNGLVALRQSRLAAKTLIDIQLQRRQDLIPKLVACVKGYAAHESATLEEAAAARAEPFGPKDMDGEAVTAARQASALSSIRAVAERYPALKASDAFLRLHRDLVDAEDRIALAREFYNSAVTAWNTRIGTLPDSVMAIFIRLGPAEYLRDEQHANGSRTGRVAP